MGCDIHLYVEARKGRGYGWKSVEKWKKDDPGCVADHVTGYYGGRNYYLFAILADVRNGLGFAGTKTGDGFNPISEPRGLPKDCDPRIKARSDEWDSDGHSHSYHTVEDLLAYDWTQSVRLEGDMDGVAFEAWDRWDRHHGEFPKNYAAEIWSQSAVRVTVPEMEKRCRAARDKLHEAGVKGSAWNEAMQKEVGNLIVRADWKLPYYKCATEFLSATLPQLWRLGEPEHVRIVFWFDN